MALEFQNQNAGDIFAPSTVHAGNGCQPGKNAVYAIPGGWSDACALGVTGDWVFYVIYRRTSCGPTNAEDLVAASAPALLLPPQPNPFRGRTPLEFVLRDRGSVELLVHDAAGRLVASLADVAYAPGRHAIDWDGRDANGAVLPPAVYFVTLEAGAGRATCKLVRAR